MSEGTSRRFPPQKFIHCPADRGPQSPPVGLDLMGQALPSGSPLVTCLWGRHFSGPSILGFWSIGVGGMLENRLYHLLSLSEAAETPDCGWVAGSGGWVTADLEAGPRSPKLSFLSFPFFPFFSSPLLFPSFFSLIFKRFLFLLFI